MKDMANLQEVNGAGREGRILGETKWAGEMLDGMWLATGVEDPERPPASGPVQMLVAIEQGHKRGTRIIFFLVDKEDNKSRERTDKNLQNSQFLD